MAEMTTETPKSQNWFARHKVLSVILGIIVLIIIGSALGGSSSQNNKSVPAASDKPQTSTAQKSSTPAPTPQTLLDLQGSGTKQTQKFTAAGDWDLNWSYDCSNFGNQGNFIVTVYNSDGSVSFENTEVNQLGSSGSDVQHYHKSGTYYLAIDSECNWTVNVKG